MTESTPPLGLEAWLARLAELLPADVADAAGGRPANATPAR
jgi:hypothetical protein